MTLRGLALTLSLALTLAPTARAQVDLDAIRRGVQGCPDLAADPSLGGLAAYLYLGQNTDGVNNVSPADVARFKQLLGAPGDRTARVHRRDGGRLQLTEALVSSA